MFKRFAILEEKYDVENITYEEQQVWNYLRDIYFSKSVAKYTSEEGAKQEQSKIYTILKMMRDALYGFSHWFHHYDYLIFGGSRARIVISQKYTNKFFGDILTLLGKNNCLIIESPFGDYYPVGKLDSKNVVSSRLLDLINGIICVMLSPFASKKFKIETLEHLNKEEDLLVNYQDHIVKFKITKMLMKFFFKLYRPKAVFLTCYYGRQALIVAAKECGIKVIEVQHGLIGKAHYAYNINKRLSTNYFPNILLTYGKYDKECIEENDFNPFEEIVPVGNYALEQIAEQDVPKGLTQITKKYKYSISVSTQFTVEKELAIFIKEVALENEGMCFLLSLRHYDKNYYKPFNLPENVYLFHNEYSCYDILKVSDTHLTCYSTCAIESLYFGKKALLLNINGLSDEVYSHLKTKNIYIIENVSDFTKYYKEEFVVETVGIYEKHYRNNLQNFIDNVIK